MAYLIVLIAALLGLSLGSFLNVCIVRLPRNESVIAPRSHCRQCSRALRPIDNVPLLSWLILCGRCRWCRERVSVQYPLVELATAVWFVTVALPFAHVVSAGSSVDVLLAAGVHSAAMAVLGFLLIGLAVMDWQTQVLPIEFTAGGLCCGTLFAFSESFFLPAVQTQTLFTPEERLIASRLGAALCIFLLLKAIGLVYRLLRGRAGMGGGDALLAATIGVFLGGWPLAVAMFTGLLLAFLWALMLLVRHRGDATTRIPFGTFLCVGGLFAALWGQHVADWYRALFV